MPKAARRRPADEAKTGRKGARPATAAARPPRRGRRRSAARLTAARVPAPFREAFLRAQDYVARYFQERHQNPRRGTISIAGERYLLLRAAAMSVEFFDLVTSLYQDKGPEEARRVASNLLFDVAHAVGKSDARTLHQRMGVTDPIEKLSAGPIHFSHAGFAFVEISPESRPSPDADFFLIYDHPYSFESDAWLRRGRRSEFPVCVMNAGYSSGWCEESFGVPLVAAEIECLAAGGRRCRFIMAPPSRVEEHLARHVAPADRARRSKGSTPVPLDIPEFFQRKRMEDELRRSHESLERRVDERTAELQDANQQLRREVAERRRAEEVRDEFLSVAAHELKTPLTGLKGFAQLVIRRIARSEPLDPRGLVSALEAIDRQATKLSRLVSQLLDVSRLEAGRLGLDARLTDVVPLIAGAVEAARASNGQRSLEVHTPASLMAVVDPLRLEQVVTNLIDNALKYSPDGGPIEVEAHSSGGSLLLSVRDHGIGIPPEHREKVFERFYQAHPEHRLGGMGLGLYISRQIVDLHHGRLTTEHPADGGTRVVVSPPLDPGAPEGPGRSG